MASDPEGVTTRLTIVNPHGMHARPISEFVKVVQGHAVSVTVVGPGGEADGGSVLQLMGLAAGQGSELIVTAQGAQAAEVLAALTELVASGFGES